MITASSFNSYINTSNTLNNSRKQSSRLNSNTEDIQEEIRNSRKSNTRNAPGSSDVKSVETSDSSLRQYNEIANENKNFLQQNLQINYNQPHNKFNSNKDKLSYSTLEAISQYTHNSNLERKEKASQLLGLSIYA